MVRVRFRSLGITVRVQVSIGVHRVDLLIGDRLIIECDSKRHHSDWRWHEADRARDRELMAMGYIVVRLTYAQIVDQWETVLPDLLALIRRGDHLWSRSQRPFRAPARKVRR